MIQNSIPEVNTTVHQKKYSRTFLAVFVQNIYITNMENSDVYQGDGQILVGL